MMIATMTMTMTTTTMAILMMKIKETLMLTGYQSHSPCSDCRDEDGGNHKFWQ